MHKIAKRKLNRDNSKIINHLLCRSRDTRKQDAAQKTRKQRVEPDKVTFLRWSINESIFHYVFHFVHVASKKLANGWWKLINLSMTERKIVKSIQWQNGFTCPKAFSLTFLTFELTEKKAATRITKQGSLNYFSCCVQRFSVSVFCVLLLENFFLRFAMIYRTHTQLPAVSLFHFNKLLSLKMREWSAIKIIMMQKSQSFMWKIFMQLNKNERSTRVRGRESKEEWNKQPTTALKQSEVIKRCWCGTVEV